MKNIYLFLSALICSATAFAQGQNNNWLVNSANSISFNSGSPVVSAFTEVNNGGTASISNNAGVLLFNTNGNTVYDANQNAMPNGTGLQGIYSMIVPDPASANSYYIFSVTNSLVYSKVDMSLNGGLGDVTIKNVLVSTDIAGFTVTRQRDGINFWVVCRSSENPFSENFKSFLVSATGIGPAVSSPAVTGGGGISTGTVKISDNGCFLVSTELGNFDFPRKQVALYQFNNYSGSITNGAVINTLSYPSSTAFSPDNTKLYVGQAHQLTFNAGDPIILQPILQYDLNAGTNAQILAAPTPVSSAMTVYALQQAPDNKIYFTRLLDGPAGTLAARTDDSHHTLGSIESPNAPGAASNVSESQLTSASIYLNRALPPNYNLTYTGALNICSGVFAVQWSYFKGKEQDKNALLTWKIENSAGIQNFDIEYTVDGKFSAIGNVSVNGGTNNIYQFTDQNFGSYKSDAVFYRIKAHSTDGSIKYSSIITLNRKDKAEVLQVYPNPFVDQISVTLKDGAEKILSLTLYDPAGKEVIRNIAGETVLSSSKSMLPGMYLLRIVTDKRSYLRTVIKN